MKYKDYPKQIWDQIHLAVNSLPKSGAVAAFDADGTLWDTDLGENFFNYLIDHQLVSLPQDPWGHYTSLKASEPKKAYLWLAQILAGKSLAQVKTWAEEAVAEIKPIPVFDEQKKLIAMLKQKNVEIFVITASVTWSVQAGIGLLGLDPSCVIGVETKIKDGIVTTEQAGPISYKEGKVEALFGRNGSRRPFLACGNTEGDLALLESATDLRIAVSASARDDRLFKTESALSDFAKTKNWISHRFIFGSN
ncbi:MAG: haloacid dehalogenase-like hydrolase [Bdellovibrionota bacterium]